MITCNLQPGAIVEPNYIDIGLLLNVAGFEQVLNSKAVAWGLIKLRSIDQRESHRIETHALISKAKHLSKGWNDLLQMTTKRSYPINNTIVESITTPTSISTPTSQPNPTSRLSTSSQAATPKHNTKVQRPGWELPLHSSPKKMVSMRYCKFGCKNTNLNSNDLSQKSGIG